jgi:hypothetical protein
LAVQIEQTSGIKQLAQLVTTQLGEHILELSMYLVAQVEHCSGKLHETQFNILQSGMQFVVFVIDICKL